MTQHKVGQYQPAYQKILRNPLAPREVGNLTSEKRAEHNVRGGRVAESGRSVIWRTRRPAAVAAVAVHPETPSSNQ